MMNNPNFKLTFIQLLIVCITVMIYVSISDGLSLCMPKYDIGDIAPDPLPLEPKGNEEAIITLAAFLIGCLVGLLIGHMLGVPAGQPPIDSSPTALPPSDPLSSSR